MTSRHFAREGAVEIEFDAVMTRTESTLINLNRESWLNSRRRVARREDLILAGLSCRTEKSIAL